MAKIFIQYIVDVVMYLQVATHSRPLPPPPTIQQKPYRPVACTTSNSESVKWPAYLVPTGIQGQTGWQPGRHSLLYDITECVFHRRSFIVFIQQNVEVEEPPSGCEVYYNTIVTPEAVNFVAQLVSTFNLQVDEVECNDIIRGTHIRSVPRWHED